MGVILLVSWVVSIGALVSPNNSITGFVILNWALVIDSIAILVVGTALWFYTLKIQDNYLAVWQAQSSTTKIAVQDLVRADHTGTVVQARLTFRLVQVLWLLRAE